MKRFCFILLTCCVFCASEAFAQKLVFTRNGIRSSDNVLESQIEYAYKSGVSKKEFRSHCIQRMSQPDFFSYKIEYADDNLFKLCGAVKTGLLISKQNVTFRLNIIMEEQSAKVSAELLDKNGKNRDCNQFFSKNGQLKRDWKHLKTDLENKLDEIIRSMMEMKVVMQ